MNLKASQLEVDNWIKNHGVRYFNELTNMAQLTEEVGEAARIIARRYGEQSEKESDKNKDLGEELADVVFVVLCLANQTGIDLQVAFDKKMDIKTNRDRNFSGQVFFHYEGLRKDNDAVAIALAKSAASILPATTW